MFLLVPHHLSPSFVCPGTFKLYATLNITEIPTKRPKYAYALVCNPTYENKFCLLGAPTEWRPYFCRCIKEIIKCPLYEKFQVFRDFLHWKTRTKAVKIRFSFGITENFFETDFVAVTPAFRCRDIKKLKRNHTMFMKKNLKTNMFYITRP